MLLKVEDKSYQLSLHDFDDIMQIGETELPNKRYKPSADLVNRFTSKNNVCMKKVKKILEKKEDVDDFMRAFALLCLKYVVCAPSHGKLCKTFLHYVENVEDLKSQPWAGLAKKQLQTDISKFKNSVKESVKNNKIYLGGPMVFLQLYHDKHVLGKEIEKLKFSDKEPMIEKMEEGETSKNKEDNLEVPQNDFWKVCIELENMSDEFCNLRDPILKGIEEKDEFSEEKLRHDENTTSGEKLRHSKFSEETGLSRESVPILLVDRKPQESFTRASVLPTSPSYAPFFVVSRFFFPLLKDHHFFLIVFNNEEHKVEVWDTLQKKHVNEYADDIMFLCQFLDERTQGIPKFKQYTPTQVSVPQQDTESGDCGVYVCRSMEYPDEVMKFHNEKWISKDQRVDLALRILNAPENIRSAELRKEFERHHIKVYQRKKKKIK